MEVIALDTNVFIWAFERSDKYGEKARVVLEKIKEQNPKVYISVLVLEEFLIKIYKKNLEKDINYYEELITNGGTFTIVDINKQIARIAAKIRAEYPSLRAPDAIHLASATESGAKTFITTDRRLPKKIGKLEIRVL